MEPISWGTPVRRPQRPLRIKGSTARSAELVADYRAGTCFRNFPQQISLAWLVPG